MRKTSKLPEALTDTEADNARGGAGGQGGQKGPPFLDVNGDNVFAAETDDAPLSKSKDPQQQIRKRK